MEIISQNRALRISIVFLVVFGLSTAFTYAKLRDTKNQLFSSTAALEESQFQLSEANEEKAELKESLENERENVAQLSGKLAEATGTINEFEKLSRIDPQLLQKYSKVYFLNENYEPTELQEITTKYLFKPEDPELIHEEVWPDLRRLLARAERDKAPLKVISAFRSFEEQTSLKNGYKTIFGSGANQFSADQGYSEHQLGTTVDFGTEGGIPADISFEKTNAFKWLTLNAHRYGFVLSYPPNNKFYNYEPWHWRFVGVDLATNLHNDEMYFYEMDQREIDKYLIKIFD